MLQITENAAKALAKMLAKRASQSSKASEESASSQKSPQEKSPQGLRISVEKGGCAGLQYSIQISSKEASDLTQKGENYQIFLAKESLALLENCTLDYRNSLHDAGFIIENPQAVRSCGCGTSFELNPDSPLKETLSPTKTPPSSSVSNSCSSEETLPSSSLN